MQRGRQADQRLLFYKELVAANAKVVYHLRQHRIQEETASKSPDPTEVWWGGRDLTLDASKSSCHLESLPPYRRPLFEGLGSSLREFHAAFDEQNLHANSKPATSHKTVEPASLI